MTIEQKQAVSLEQASVKTERLPGRWFMVARVMWTGLALLALGLFIVSIPSYFAYLLSVCHGTSQYCSTSDLLTPAGVQAFEQIGLSLHFYAGFKVARNLVFILGYFTMAGVLFWRRPDDRLALIAAFALMTFPFTFTGGMLSSLPAIWWLPSHCINFLGAVSLALFFYLFPDGRFAPRWIRWFLLGWVLYEGMRLFFPSSSLNPFIRFSLLNLVTLVGLVGSVVVVVIYRYRRVSSMAERQQTKWVVFGVSLGVGGFLAVVVLTSLLSSLFSPDTVLSLGSGAALYLFLLFIPLSIGIAILRSRLFDIDLFINRTLVYGILTVSIVGLYVLVVGGLGALLQAQGNLLLSLLATGLIALLFQPLRVRFQRGVNRLMYGERDDPYSIISRLGTRLEAALVPDAILPTIVETVAQALKLPYAAIEVQEGEQIRLAASYGAAMPPSLRVPLLYQQETIGYLVLASRSPGETFTRADHRLLGDLAHQAGIAAHTVRLTADLVESRERLLLAREEERRRLARELHDSVSQALYGISLGAHTARKALERDPAQVAEPLDYVLSLAEAGLAEMRALIFELRPESLEQEGLVAALTKQAAARRARHQIVVSTELCNEPDLALHAKQELYRIAQEALHNTVKHARAREVTLRLAQTAEGVTLVVHDDGAGFDTTASFPGHLGLHSMRERVASLGGSLQIESAPGQGTTVRAHLPAQSAAD
ncbi:MAG TPA: GAF domain-containing sensor histidine kinase [Ktedonobacterales bacterium]|nr:GAF domain-containing sensor histidine kinase [Ktedonobacterales bacterium]